jgi:transposase
MLIPVDDSVRLLSQILEGLDYSKLYQAYSIKGRKPAVDPKTMFKVLTYAYMNGIYTTHKIESACRRDINFLWLLAGCKAPDHATVARFRQKYLAESVDDLFYQMVNELYDLGEVQFENVFIDGTKIEANANRYTFVWKSSVNKNELKMFEKIKNLVSEISLAEMKGFTISAGSLIGDMSRILDYLNDKKVSEEIEFVHGIGKRKTQLQRWIEQLGEYRARQEKYNESNQLFQGRNSYSKTDTDATFMHMKDDHMRNSQLKPGYNVQIGVESEYVTGVGIFQDRNDIATLIPMLEMMKENIGRKYTNVIADSGYESEENYLYLEKNSQTAFIKPQTYEVWKKKSFKNDISKRENMIYDGEKDEYTCHSDKKLKKIGITHKTSATGYRSEITLYECENCEGCLHKSKCTKAAGNRRMQVSKTFVEKRDVSYQNIMSDMGILLRVNRSIQVEGAFGVLKNDYNFTRFLTRGKTSVKTEFMLLCFGYNLNKLHSKIQSERCGQHLHPLKEIA